MYDAFPVALYIGFQKYPKNFLVGKIILVSLNFKKYWY